MRSKTMVKETSIWTLPDGTDLFSKPKPAKKEQMFRILPSGKVVRTN